MTSEQSYADEYKIGPLNICFYGGAGAGKSTSAQYLVDKHGYDKRPIAKSLKDCCKLIWPMEPEGFTRHLPQQLGIKVREIEEDAWVNAWYEETKDLDGPIVNDDMRFPNEYWKLKELGYVFVRVLAKETARVDRLLRIGKLDDTSQLEHESETALVGLEATKAGITDDFTIFNDGDLPALYQQIENVLAHIEEGN